MRFKVLVCGSLCPIRAQVWLAATLRHLLVHGMCSSSRGMVASSIRRLASCCCPEMHLA
jgi:hypothetical protein